MTQEDFKKNIEGAVNDFVDGIATRGQLFSAIMNTILQMEKKRPPTIKVRIERQDNLEGFAAYLTPSLTQDGTAIVLMNVEATFHAAAANNESPVDFMIENVMHEVGHALQEFFGKEFSEEQVEGIVEKYRERYLPDVGAKTVLSPAGPGERMELLLRISALGAAVARYEGMLKAWEDQIFAVSGVNSPSIAAEKFSAVQEELQQIRSAKDYSLTREEVFKVFEQWVAMDERRIPLCDGFTPILDQFITARNEKRKGQQ